MSDRPAHPDATLLAMVALGGVLGSLGRYAVGLALPHTRPRAGSPFPWSTLVVNVSGALAMGLLVAYLVDRPGVHRLARPFVGVGVLGGWTTFSTLAVDAITLAEGGSPGLAVLYVGATFALGVLAVAVGNLAGQRVWPGP